MEKIEQLLIGRRILILDDRPEVAKELARAVHEAGAAVEGPYGDLTEAQAAVRCGGFDSVVMRAELRGRSTATVAMTLRTKLIPVISAVRPDVVDQLSGLSRRAA